MHDPNPNPLSYFGTWVRNPGRPADIGRAILATIVLAGPITPEALARHDPAGRPWPVWAKWLAALYEEGVLGINKSGEYDLILSTDDVGNFELGVDKLCTSAALRVDNSAKPVHKEAEKDFSKNPDSLLVSSRRSLNDERLNDDKNPVNNTPQKIAKKSRGRPRGPVSTGDDGFDAFWLRYPKDAGKKQALAQWTRIKPAPAQIAEIMNGLEHALKSDRWNRDGGAYVPDAFRWLRDERWRDRLPSSARVALSAPDIPRGDELPRSPAPAPEIATQKSDEAIPSDRVPPLLSAYLRHCVTLESTGRMSSLTGRLDQADVEILRRDPIGRTVVKAAQQYLRDAVDAAELRPATFRIGHRPLGKDEWVEELAARLTELKLLLVTAGITAETFRGFDAIPHEIMLEP